MRSFWSKRSGSWCTGREPGEYTHGRRTRQRECGRRPAVSRRVPPGRRAASAHAEHDALARRRRIGRARDRPADHEVVGAGLDRRARRQHAHLIVAVGAVRAGCPARRDRTPRRTPRARPRRPRPRRRRRRGRPPSLRTRATPGDASASPGRRRSTVTARTERHRDARLLGPACGALAAAAAHHRLATERVHVEHRHAEPGDVRRGRAPRCSGCRAAWRRGTPARAPRRAARRRGRAPRTAPARPSACRRAARDERRAARPVEVARRRARPRAGSPGAGSRRSRSLGARAERRGHAQPRRARPPATRAPSPSGSARSPWATVDRAPRDRSSVAVPTCTAHAPASNISTASSPVRTPPTPMIGTSGIARATSKHRAQRERPQRRARQPAGHRPEPGPQAIASHAQRRDGVHRS